jgi:N-formylglutamate deformylase
LLTNLPQMGATVVQAEAPRCYIDLNRAVDDIWPMQLRDAWAGPFKLRPTNNCDRGTGLIWTHAGDVPMYREAPTSAAVQARIENHYWPYYAALEREGVALRERFGRLWHLNMHSMPPSTNNGKYDVVLGDLDGQSCAREFLKVVNDAFVACGMRVTHNDPYKGAQLTRTLGQPDQGSESLQIELSKGLYLKDDLITLDKQKFADLQRVIDTVVRAAGEFTRAQISKTPEKVDLRASSRSFIGMFLPKSARDVTP